MDPRYITAVALLIVGIAALSVAARILSTHPINRVFTLGPFVTEEGLRALLKYTPTIVALGMFALACGASNIAYALRWEGRVSTETAYFFGYLEAGTAIWAGVAVIVTAVRLWRRG